MELTPPRPKKWSKSYPTAPLPLIKHANGDIYKFKANFDGFSIVIDEVNDMEKIVSLGFFGKGNLSRSHPLFRNKNVDIIPIIRSRQFQRRKIWGQKSKPPKKISKIVVVPDSDSDEDYFTNLKPKYEIDTSGISEVVHLGLEEAFFLMDALKCLSINYNNNLLDNKSAWNLFMETDPCFPQKYAVYFHFRSKNWVVKPGLKFGGDFLLYKEGPSAYHASYVVIIQLVDNNFIPKEHMTKRSMDTSSLLGLHRLCETAGKELLICQVLLPTNDKVINFSDLSNIYIKEVLMKRWISSQERTPQQNRMMKCAQTSNTESLN